MPLLRPPELTPIPFKWLEEKKAQGCKILILPVKTTDHSRFIANTRLRIIKSFNNVDISVTEAQIPGTEFGEYGMYIAIKDITPDSDEEAQAKRVSEIIDQSKGF